MILEHIGLSQINGSLAHITAIFGFTLAGLIVQDAVRRLNDERAGL